jgi:hypothetical protein
VKEITKGRFDPNYKLHRTQATPTKKWKTDPFDSSKDSHNQHTQRTFLNPYNDFVPYKRDFLTSWTLFISLLIFAVYADSANKF